MHTTLREALGDARDTWNPRCCCLGAPRSTLTPLLRAQGVILEAMVLCTTCTGGVEVAQLALMLLSCMERRPEL